MRTLQSLKEQNEKISVIGKNLNLLNKSHPACLETSLHPIEEFIPSIEMNYLQEKFGYLEKDRRRNKGDSIPFLINQSVKNYLYHAVNPRRKHLQIEKSFYLYSGSYDDIKRFTKPYYGFYPKDLFKYLEDEEILKTLSVESKRHQTTRAYKLTNKTWDRLNDYLTKFEIDQNQIVDVNLDEEAISHLDSSGNQRQSTIQLPRWIDIKKINPHYSSLSNITSKEFQKLSKKISDDDNNKFDDGDYALFKFILGNLETFDGHLRQDYVESPFGRLYGRRSDECIQLMPKRILPFIIPKTFVYDLQASCYSLISQMAKKIDANLQTPSVDYYVKNRNRIRTELADEIGVDVKKIKRCFTIIGHGGRQTEHTWYENGEVKSGSLYKILGSQKISDFYSNQLVIDISAEIKLCSKTIVSNNSYPLFIPKSVPKRLAYSYQKTEVMVLQRIIEYLQINKKQDNQILSIKHDGLITSKSVNQRNVEDYVYDKTGYKITLDEERVGSIY